MENKQAVDLAEFEKRIPYFGQSFLNGPFSQGTSLLEFRIEKLKRFNYKGVEVKKDLHVENSPIIDFYKMTREVFLEKDPDLRLIEQHTLVNNFLHESFDGDMEVLYSLSLKFAQAVKHRVVSNLSEEETEQAIAEYFCGVFHIR